MDENLIYYRMAFLRNSIVINVSIWKKRQNVYRTDDRRSFYNWGGPTINYLTSSDPKN